MINFSECKTTHLDMVAIECFFGTFQFSYFFNKRTFDTADDNFSLDFHIGDIGGSVWFSFAAVTFLNFLFTSSSQTLPRLHATEVVCEQ